MGEGPKMTQTGPVNFGWTTSHLGRCEHCRRPVSPAVVLHREPDPLTMTSYACVPCAAARLGVSEQEVRETADRATARRAAAVVEARAFLTGPGQPLEDRVRHLETVATEGLSILAADLKNREEG